MALGLRVEELTPAELTRATTVRRERKELSTADTFAFAIAEGRRWPLLPATADYVGSQPNAVAFHGVLWICDQFENGKHVPRPRLHAGLTAISAHPRCRYSRVQHFQLAGIAHGHGGGHPPPCS